VLVVRRTTIPLHSFGGASLKPSFLPIVSCYVLISLYRLVVIFSSFFAFASFVILMCYIVVVVIRRRWLMIGLEPFFHLTVYIFMLLFLCELFETFRRPLLDNRIVTPLYSDCDANHVSRYLLLIRYSRESPYHLTPMI